MTTRSSPDFGVPAFPLSNNRTPEDLPFQHGTSPDGSFNSISRIPLGASSGVGFFLEPDTSLNQFNFLDETLAGYSTQTQCSLPDLIGGIPLGPWSASDLLKDTSETVVAGNSFHGESNINSGISCDECGTPFDKKRALALHAKQTKHAAYICRCGERCSRVDVLQRHIRTFQPTTTYPCPYCNKFRGTKAFTRRDHLLQHWRGHHNIELISDSDESRSTMGSLPRLMKKLSCPHEDCPYFRGQQSQDQHPFQETDPAFRTQRELTTHLREVHSESPFECTEPYCSRKGGQGFFRKGDLLKHQKKHHSVSGGT